MLFCDVIVRRTFHVKTHIEDNREPSSGALFQSYLPLLPSVENDYYTLMDHHFKTVVILFYRPDASVLFCSDFVLCVCQALNMVSNNWIIINL